MKDFFICYVLVIFKKNFFVKFVEILFGFIGDLGILKNIVFYYFNKKVYLLFRREYRVF